MNVELFLLAFLWMSILKITEYDRKKDRNRVDPKFEEQMRKLISKYLRKFFFPVNCFTMLFEIQQSTTDDCLPLFWRIKFD